MAVKVQRIKLWRVEVENKPGALAKTLAPLAGAGADLKVVMGYRYPGDEMKAAIEVYPVSGKKREAAAQEAGLAQAAIPTLLVEGDDRPGLGYELSKALADANINISFMVAQVIGRKYSAVFGFETESDAKKASSLITKVAGKKK